MVVTGGHLEKAIDLLSFTTARGIEEEVFKADRQRSNSTHGTGCAFSTALACHLAHGRGLPGRFFSPKCMSRPRLRMPIRWATEWGRCITSTA